MLQTLFRRAPRPGDVILSRRLGLALTALANLTFYLWTLQYGVNGSQHAYATDVGEIQNALPRWGTIHYPGYPLYSLLGSLLVTLLRPLGVEPAAGTSLLSALWGGATVALIYALACELGARPLLAALGATVAGLSTSLWMDSSLAEIHTMGLALALASLYFALRFGRTGERKDLLLLALCFSQGLAHQRTTLFLAPALALLVWPHWRALGRGWPATVGIILLAPLTYLYLPLRAWMGADWTFGAVGTWDGLLSIFLDTKVDRVIALPGDPAGWLERAAILAGLLHRDLWLPVLALGLAGILLLAAPRQPKRRDTAKSAPYRLTSWRTPLALTLAWLPSAPLCLLIWEGSVSDALLAAKLPIVALGGVGLACAGEALARRGRWAGRAFGALLLVGIIVGEVCAHRPEVLAVTRDRGAERTIAMAERVAQPQGGAPATFVALWGHRYWALTYAQAYRHQLSGLNLVDHNVDLRQVAARGERILTFSETLYHLPLAWWEERLGRVHLSSPAPNIVEIKLQATTDEHVPPGPALDLENGIRILSASLTPGRRGSLIVTVYWQAYRPVAADYSVAVHLLAQDPPQGQDDLLAQADRQHPVGGWYPTSLWEAGEVVRGTAVLRVPPGSRPKAVRLGMYTVASDGSFENSPWLTLKVGS